MEDCTYFETAYLELIVFGDVQAGDKLIVQTWHRTARIENGKITKAVYGYTFPGFPPARQDPAVEDFFRALFTVVIYWEKLLSDPCPASLPESDWADMSPHAFAKENGPARWRLAQGEVLEIAKAAGLGYVTISDDRGAAKSGSLPLVNCEAGIGATAFAGEPFVPSGLTGTSREVLSCQLQ